VGLGCRLDDAEAFELLEPLGEQGAGEPGRAGEDFAEGFAAQMHVADDQRRPALGEDLRAAGDRAVLAVGPHEHSVLRFSAGVKSRFFTSKSRSLTSARYAPDVAMGPSTRGGTMTAPTTTMQIPGFGGEVIAPGHDRYDDARAVWNATVGRRPRLVARC